MYFLVYPFLFVVSIIGISPVPPGGIGSLGQSFKTVQPQAAFTE